MSQRFEISLPGGETYNIVAHNIFEAYARAEEIDQQVNGGVYDVAEFASSDNRERRLRDGFAMQGGR